MPATPAWVPPQEFDEYRLIRAVGQGGMGQVFLAQDLVLDRLVAVKFIADIDAHPVARERFLIEARAVARLQHPNVATVYRVGEVAGRPYLVSEFVRGRNLDEVPLPIGWPRLLKLAIGLARGLAAAHRRGVLHRDIKASNAIVTDDGEVKLLDFGLAKLLDVVPGAAAVAEAQAQADAAPPPRRPATIDGQEPVGPDAPTMLPSAGDASAPVTAAADLERTRPDAGAFGDDGLLGRTTPPGGGLEQTLLAAGGVAAAPGSDAPGTTVSDGPAAALRATPGGRTGGGALLAVLSRTGSSSPNLTQAGQFLGTPLYMSPEAWQGEPATLRSDVYSLGVLLFYLAAGRPPYEQRTLPQLMAAVCHQDPPALASVAPGCDPGFGGVVARCLQRDPAARFASAEELRDALEQLTPEARAVSVPRGNPYRGLHAFEAEHRALFFGRGAEIRAVLERLRTEPALVVAGDSGVGKSSLCRAGVLPRVADGELGTGRSFALVPLVPGARPVAALAAALGPTLGADEVEVQRLLLAGPRELLGRLRQRLGERRGLVIFIDQAEELVTMSAPAEAAALAEVIAELCIPRPGLRLLMTVRGDFLTRLASLPGLAEPLTRAIYLLRPLTEEGVREAILGPARAKGVSFASEAMVAELQAAATASGGGLPLLQFALAELWDARDVAASVIPEAALQAVGGVAGALARHADGVLAALLPEQRQAARGLLLQLVTAGGTRARRAETELVATNPAARVALDALVRGRLVVARDAEEGGIYEVAHEALIDGWPQLRRWLEDDAGARVVRERLVAAAAEWQRLGRPRDALWGPRQLAELPPGAEADLAPREAAFVRAARRALRDRWLFRGVGAAVLVLVALGLWGGTRFLSAAAIRAQVERHVAESVAALTQARRGAREAADLRRQAFADFDGRRKQSGESAWARALAAAAAADRHFGRAAQALEAALAVDGTRRDVRAALADALYERALHSEQDRRFDRRDELLDRLRVYDDGGLRLARWRQAATLAVDSQPPGATVTLARYQATPRGRRQLEAARAAGATPLRDLRLEPGSYLLTLTAPGRALVRYPLLVTRGAEPRIAVDLPVAGAVPDGYVYVPAGAFLFGTFADERMRREFLSTVPGHEVPTESYLIARHETTYAQWLEFLRDLPPAERRRRTPKTATAGFHGAVELKALPGGGWQLTIQPDVKAYSARLGDPIRYPGRKLRVSQDWRRFPVSGISSEDARAYAAWLAKTGRLPGARLCTEQEWERAARGADDRELPLGDRFEPDDANFDETYGRQPLGFGLDEVGAHPASRSPFGVDDLSGNVFEWTRSSLADNEWVARGGAYYYGQNTCMVTNRQPTSPALRDFTLGFRVCAAPPAR